MANRLAPAALVLAAAIAARFGAHGAAFALLLADVPVAGAVLLASVSDRVEEKCDRTRVAVSAAMLGLIVVAATTRSPVVVSLCLAVFCLEACVGAAAEVRTAVSSPRVERA